MTLLGLGDLAETLRSQAGLLTACLALYLLGLAGASLWLPFSGLVAYVSWLLLRPHLLQTPHQTMETAAAADEASEEEAEEEAASTVEDGSPCWLSQPGTERTEWLNEIVLKLWAKTESLAALRIQEMCSGEQVVAFLRPLGGGSLTLSHFQLGDIPPRLGGVRIHSVGPDEVVLDTELAYRGTCSISLAVHLHKVGPPLNLTLQDFSLTGSFRITCKPLLNNAPFLGGVTFSFLEEPDFDFVAGGLLAVTDLPGIRQLVHAQLIKSIKETMIYPKGVHYNVTDEEISAGDAGEAANAASIGVALPAGVFSFSVVEAKDLKNTDFSVLKTNYSDPYAEIRFSVDGEAYRQQTCTSRNNLNPKWNYHQVIYVDDPTTFSDITISIFDRDKFTDDDFLGECVVYKDVIDKVVRGETAYDYWKILDKCYKGSLRVRVSWSWLGTSPPRNIDDQALLAVLVDSANNVKSEASNKPDTRVRLSIGCQVCWTRLAMATKSPQYEERLILFSENPTNDDLLVEIIDTLEETVLGSASLELTQVLGQEDLCLNDIEVSLNSVSVPRMKVRLSLALRYLQADPVFFSLQAKEINTANTKATFPTTSDDSAMLLTSPSTIASATTNNSARQSPSKSPGSQERLDDRRTPGEERDRAPTAASDSNVTTFISDEVGMSDRGDLDIVNNTSPQFRRSNTLPLSKVRK